MFIHKNNKENATPDPEPARMPFVVVSDYEKFLLRPMLLTWVFPNMPILPSVNATRKKTRRQRIILLHKFRFFSSFHVKDEFDPMRD